MQMPAGRVDVEGGNEEGGEGGRRNLPETILFQCRKYVKMGYGCSKF